MLSEAGRTMHEPSEKFRKEIQSIKSIKQIVELSNNNWTEKIHQKGSAAD